MRTNVGASWSGRRAHGGAKPFFYLFDRTVLAKFREGFFQEGVDERSQRLLAIDLSAGGAKVWQLHQVAYAGKIKQNPSTG